jgi:hypothetical protein
MVILIIIEMTLSIHLKELFIYLIIQYLKENQNGNNILEEMIVF